MFRRWMEWAGRVVRPPVVEQDIRDYVMFRAWYQPFGKGTVQAGTIEGDLSALHKWHVLHGYPWPRRSAWVNQLLAGIRRLFNKPLKQMKPWRYAMLCELVRGLNLSRAEDLTWGAGASFAYFFLLRTCEWTSASKWKLVPGQTVLIRDLAFHMVPGGAASVTFNLPSAKNDKFARGRDMVRGPCGGPVCVLTLLVRMLERRFGSLEAAFQHAEEPLFQLPEGSLLTADYGTRRIREAASRMGRNPKEYSLYSLRRGAASEAHANGARVQDIQALGGWRSLAVMQYIHSDPDWQTQNALALSHVVGPAPTRKPKRPVPQRVRWANLRGRAQSRAG